MGRLDIRVLGPLDVAIEGRRVPLGTGKQRALLAVLALRSNQVVTVADLVGAVWGDRSREEDLTASVRVHLTHLRKLLEPGRARGDTGRITWDGIGYRLQVGEQELDLLRFDRHLQRAQRAAAAGQPAAAVEEFRLAESLWRGPPFADLSDAGEVTAELAALENRRLTALEDRLELESALGGHAEVAAELVRLVAEHPLRERLHGQLMLALYRDGRQAEALDAYRRLRATLAEELGIDPAPFVQQLEQSILRQDPALNASPVPSQRVVVSRHPLPSPPDELIGRDREVAELTALLQPGASRLLTLCGPGGVGKTRLALAAAAAAADARAAGVCFVSLAGLTDPELVPGAIADALELTDIHGDPLDALVAYLADRDVLLVLDSFEHLAGAAPLIGGLLSGAAALTVLVTSRTVLRISAETIYPVRPLEVPADTARTAAQVVRSAAVELFCARARAVQAGFALTDEDAAVVGEICRRLDGLPLAIELAAARVRVLSPSSILQRLGSHLSLLTGGPVDAPDRQRTLRATLQWSYQLLDDPERTLLNRLSIFHGSFDLDAVEAVCIREDGPADGVPDTLDTLDGLVRHSLVQRTVDPGGEARFALLQTVRQAAAEQLEIAERERLRARHAAHYAACAQAAGDRLSAAPAEGDAMRRLRVEQDNIRAALEWIIERDQAETAQRLVLSLETYWKRAGAIREGLAWSTRIMELSPGDDPVLRGLAFNAAGTLAWYNGDYRQARQWHSEALRLQQNGTDLDAVAWSLSCLAVQDQAEWRDESAERHLQQALVLARRTGNRRIEAKVLLSLARQRWGEGRRPAAQRLAEESLAIVRDADLDETYFFSYALLCFAEILLHGNQPRHTMRLLGALNALEDRAGPGHHGTDRINRMRSAATAALGLATAAATWEEGRRLAPAQALREALATRPAPLGRAAAAPPTAPAEDQGQGQGQGQDQDQDQGPEPFPEPLKESLP